MLGHKASFDKFLNSWNNTKYVLQPQWNDIRISNRRKLEEFINMWKLNSIFLNNQWVKEYITREIRKYLETNEIEDTTY